MTISLAKWTIEDYHRMVDIGLLDDRPVELLHGEIVEMSPKGEAHAYFSTEAGDYLARLLGDKPDGIANAYRALVRHAKPITLPNNSEPEPDLAIVQRLGRTYLQHHPYPEQIFWVIEYANTSLEKDANLKYCIYAEAGIPEYWLVNLKRRELIVFRTPWDGEYGSKMTFTEGKITPVAFPDISIAVSEIIM